MIKLAFKNLWSRRRNNVWLFVELIMVTVIAWILVDPVCVKLYDATRPEGYDIDRLVSLTISTYPEHSKAYSPESADSASISHDLDRLLGEIRAIPTVEKAVPMRPSMAPEESGSDVWGMVLGSDTTRVMLHHIYSGEPFFSTLGIEPVAGCKTAEELDEMIVGKDEVVITEEICRRAFPDGNAVGKRLYGGRYWENGYVVKAVVKDVRLKSYMNTAYFVFDMDTWPLAEYLMWGDCKVILRMKPGVDVEDFVENTDNWKNLKAGNLYCSGASTVVADKAMVCKAKGLTSSTFVSVTFLCFFLVCLALGIIALFMLQTRRRSKDAGVLKSYGAPSSSIIGSMVIEGVILAVASWAIGCAIYLQYAVKEGLADKDRLGYAEMLQADWSTDFATHFALISGLVLVILLVVVSIGIYIPARRIASVNPVDALRASE